MSNFDQTALAKGGCLKIAAEILDGLCKRKIIRGRDNVYWMYPLQDSNKKLNLTWCDHSLYHGLSGIGLSFLYGTLFFKNEAYKEIVTRCLSSLDVMMKRKEAFNKLGAFSGLGGVLYFLDKTSEILPELGAREILSNILTLLDEKLDELLAHEFCVDIISGSSGLLAVLAGLKCNHDKMTHMMRKLMYHITDRYPDSTNLTSAVKMSDRFMLGFSHGVAGIVFALHRALKKCPMPAAVAWITRALRYERSHFDIEKGDWPNFYAEAERSAGNLSHLNWCHGIMGIVMSRLEMYKQGWYDDIILFEIALLMRGANSYQMPVSLNLCHGLTGVIDFLLEAHPYQYSSITSEKLEQHITKVMSGIQNTENIHTEFHEKLYIPGLMVGHAGIAYQCLRMAEHTLVPSVLLLQ